MSRQSPDTRKRGTEKVVDVYQRIFGLDRGERYDQTDGWFPRYCGQLSEASVAHRHVRGLHNLLGREAEGLEHKTILDLGCGFGMAAVALGVLGASSVHGVDSSMGMLKTFAAVLSDLAIPRVHPAASRAERLCYAENSFDVVLVVEALSHFLEPWATLREAHRVLKPGGVLVIADDNNGANPRVIAVNQQVWERFENGPPTENIHGHRVRVSYRERRQRIIETSFPAQPTEEVLRLANGTAFMTRADILRACREYLDGGPAPNSLFTPGRCPVEPESGQYIENVINPFDLERELKAMGFGVQLQGYFGGESRGGVVRAANQALNLLLPQSLTLRVSPGYRVRAIKCGTR